MKYYTKGGQSQKSYCHILQKSIAEYVSFIQAYRNKYTVKQLCNALKFPKSTYYAVINHKTSKREPEYNKFSTQVLSVYTEFKKRYNALDHKTPQQVENEALVA